MTHADRAATEQLGMIEVSGADAGEFLSAQLTNDVARLGPDRHFLAGWCDAKGRAIMLAQVLESVFGYLLIVPATLIEPLMKRLQMYVLRARVDLADVSADYRIGGLVGADLPGVNRIETRDGCRLLGLPQDVDGNARALVIARSHDALPERALDNNANAWELSGIDAGIPAIYPATRGLFVPQMLNMHWLLAIDFDKGCYPGQEVIARLHYRGRLTRRLFRLAWDGAQPSPGDEITDADGNIQGTVIRAAPASDGKTNGRLLAVLKIDAAHGTLRLPDTELGLLELPYATPA